MPSSTNTMPTVGTQRAGLAHKTRIRLFQLAVVVLMFGSWEGLGRAGVVDPFYFSMPSSIVARIWEWFTAGDIYTHLAITLAETILSFGIGTLLGISLGLWLGLSKLAAEVLDPFIKVFNAIPRILLAPIFVMWFGLGLTSKVALGATMVLFITFFNTYQGVREVNPVILANARLLKASRVSLLRHVYVPSATSWILSSLRASVGMAVMGAIVAEYLGSSAGLGHLIAQAEGVFDATGVFSGIVVLSAFVIALDRSVDALEGKLLVWRPKVDPETGA
ncbi:ABC transporter permease [Ralstonia mannitolilytica]|uniref:Aliphatic sulfonates transport permease protein ssuC n=2 Tax=Pseudomonadota TaxID=1224 RepID=A0AAJ4ZNS6_9RALS|nr:ABC transporter permease [Ralstonia mannitolilytica]CAG2130194.1 Putative aliphatic sulfonates transport permease protein SsuC [Ralstonia mannitolilytica]CAJ0735683.1 Putative aliphatic sulfonates transport permease protein SsuC [Ralstonia mannitolilytica]SUE24538.1 Putative aliphatic sulfonates transport permease protein ssuC [Ralstonia mannitolilytica]SUE25558.1 Putative aliphatic sulfonates transport permease protein ssuC [Ralstonia mannitolilytica]SUE35367.1 Putative aliphatic sulfonate